MNKTIRIFLGMLVLLLLVATFLIGYMARKSESERITRQAEVVYVEVFTRQVPKKKVQRLISDNRKVLGESRGPETQHKFKQNKRKLTVSLNIAALRVTLQKIKHYGKVPEGGKTYASAITRYARLDPKTHVKLPMSEGRLIKECATLNKLRKLFVDKEFTRVKSGITETQLEEVSGQIENLSSDRLKEFVRRRLWQVFISMNTAQALANG